MLDRSGGVAEAAEACAPGFSCLLLRRAAAVRCVGSCALRSLGLAREGGDCSVGFGAIGSSYKRLLPVCHYKRS